MGDKLVLGLHLAAAEIFFMSQYQKFYLFSDTVPLALESVNRWRLSAIKVLLKLKYRKYTIRLESYLTLSK